MLRKRVSRQGVLSSRRGWFCAGPDSFRREANHEGMLRSGMPRGGVTSPRCGWFCAGPDSFGPKRGQSRRPAAIRGAARRRNITQVWIVLRRARAPRREANHDGMLRSGVPRGDVTYPKCGWFCAGPVSYTHLPSPRDATLSRMPSSA